jgi:hypothetical protein
MTAPGWWTPQPAKSSLKSANNKYGPARAGPFIFAFTFGASHRRKWQPNSSHDWIFAALGPILAGKEQEKCLR